MSCQCVDCVIISVCVCLLISLYLLRTLKCLYIDWQITSVCVSPYGIMCHMCANNIDDSIYVFVFAVCFNFEPHPGADG